MRILHLNTEPTWRGGEQQVLYLMEGLRRAGVVQAIACQPGGEMRRRAEAQGFRVHPIRMRGEVDPVAVWRLARLIRRERPSILHMHTSHAHTLGVLAASWAGIVPRPRTLVARRVDFSIFRHSFFGLNRWKYTLGVDRIVCVSEAIRQVLIRDGLDPARLGVVHSGIDLGRFRDVPDRGEEYRRSWGIPRGVPVVGTVGHCAGHKGQRYLIEAVPRVLARSPETRFVIVGEGELLADLKALARELEVSSRVIFAGFRTDVPELLRFFDLFCFPSVEEGLGTSVLDALAMRRPVVATTAGGIPEMIVPGVHGVLVEPRRPEELAAGIVWCLAHPREARRMAERGRRRVEERFSVERMVAGTLREYERLLDGARGDR